MTDTDPKKCILIVGMHRSGTSLMAGILRIAGVDFGKRFLGYDKGNIKGHFEHIDILNANNAILSALGSSWNDAKPLPENWQCADSIAVHKNSIKKIIARDFNQSKLFGIKEPRVSILLPLYLDILNELSIEPLFVVMKRPFQEIAESLYARDKISSEEAISLCNKYWNSIMLLDGKFKRVLIDFDRLLNDTAGSMKEIASTLCIKLKDDQAVHREIAELIDPKLKHFYRGKLTYDRFKNDVVRVVDAMLPINTKRRKFVKRLVNGFRGFNERESYETH